MQNSLIKIKLFKSKLFNTIKIYLDSDSMQPNALPMEMATAIMNAYTNKTFGDNGTFSIIGNGFGIELWHCVDDTITAEIRTETLMNVHIFNVDYISIETHPDLRLAIHGRGDISIPITLE